MAPFDQDPKTPGTSPAPSPGVSGIFSRADAAGTQPGDDANSSAGEFTKLFGKPPQPAPLEGIGTTSSAAASIASAPVVEVPPTSPAASKTDAPGSFTMIFGSNPLAPKVEAQPPEPPGEAAANFEPTVAYTPPPAQDTSGGSGPVAKAESSPRAGVSFTSLFSSPAASPEAEAYTPPPPQPPSSEPAGFSSPAEPPRGPSEFTMMFGGPARPVAGATESAARPTTPAATPANTPAAMFPKQEPKGTLGTFTQLFGNPAGSSAGVPAQPLGEGYAPAEQPTTQPASQPATPEEFANIFNFPLRDSSSTPEPAHKAVPGAFTSMFDSAPASPASPTPEPAAKDPGAFTKLFNAPVPSAAQPSQDFNQMFTPPPVEARRDSFTGIFGEGAGTANNATSPMSYPPGSQNYPSSGPEASPNSGVKQPMDGWPMATPSQPSSPTSTGAPSSGATQIFTRPGDAPAPAPPPSGPSAFTQVISGGLVREAAQRAAMQGGQPAGPSLTPPTGFPGVAPGTPMSPTPPVAPPLPNYGQPPGMNAPGMWPVQPPMPHMQAPSLQYPQMQMQQPQMPHMQMPQPQMPQPPMAQLPSGAPPKTNWMPVIIAVNIFVVIVVLLILVFALRK